MIIGPLIDQISIFFNETKFIRLVISIYILFACFIKDISLNVDFMAKKPQRVHKTGHISVFNFYPIAVTKKVSHPSFFNIFA